MQKTPKFIKGQAHRVIVAKRKSKKRAAKPDPLMTPVHWNKGDVIKRAAIVKLFPKDIQVRCVWSGASGTLKSMLKDPSYIVRVARVNKDESWRSYHLASDNISFGFSEGQLTKFHRFLKPLVRFAAVPKPKGRVKVKPKKKKKASKAKKTSRPKRTT